MNKNLLKNKEFILGIILLLAGISTLPSITGNNGQQNVIIQINDQESSSLPAVDWWPMFHHDLNLTGYSTSTAPMTNKVLWATQRESGGWFDPQHSSPTIVNDTIYIGIMDPSWPKSTTIFHEFGLQKEYLPLQHPFKIEITKDGKSFLERWYESYLLCMNATTGVEKWKTRLENEYFIRGSPAIAGGKAYIITSEDPFGPFGHLYCLDATTGAILWNVTLNGTEPFSPAVKDGKVYASGWILGENSTKICKLFCLDAETGSEVYNTTLGIGEPTDAASIYNNHLYISVWDDDVYETYLSCVNIANGSLHWTKNLSGNYWVSAPVIYYEKIYVISSSYDFIENMSCYIGCFDAITGAPQWNQSIQGGANAWSTPVLAYDKIYFTVVYESSDPYQPDQKGWVYCLEATTGNLLWYKLLTEDSILISSPACADGKIYINSMGYSNIHGYMFCLDAITGDGIWQYWLNDPIYSSPAIANGRLYLASWDYFYTFDDSAPYDAPPIVTITGPRLGIPGYKYNYTLSFEDPEGHLMKGIFEWSREWPGGYYGMESPSGGSINIELPFEEEGDYWMRLRAQDTTRYTWSNWTKFNVTIVEPTQMFLFGLVNHVEEESDYKIMNATFVFYIRQSPFKVGFLSTDTQIITLDNSPGYLGSRLIAGRFQAAIG